MYISKVIFCLKILIMYGGGSSHGMVANILDCKLHLCYYIHFGKGINPLIP